MSYGIEFDMLGEHKVKIEGDQITRLPECQSTEVFILNDTEKEVLRGYWDIAQASSAKGRKIPLTKREAEQLFRYKDIKRLITKGILKEVSLWITKDGAKKEMRTCIVLTEEGRVYSRGNYEKVSGDTGEPRSIGFGSVNGERERVDSATV